MGWEGMDRIYVAQDKDLYRALVNNVKGGKYLE
jgi:hypothetical protein